MVKAYSKAVVMAFRYAIAAAYRLMSGVSTHGTSVFKVNKKSVHMERQIFAQVSRYEFMYMRPPDTAIGVRQFLNCGRRVRFFTPAG